jgi:hypothetical protein
LAAHQKSPRPVVRGDLLYQPIIIAAANLVNAAAVD